MYFKKRIILYMFFVGFAMTAHGAKEDVKIINSPPKLSGVQVISLNDIPGIPDVFRNQSRNQIKEMRSNGYVYVPEDKVSYIDKAINAKENNKNEIILRPLSDLNSILAFSPARIPVDKFNMKSIGAIPSGVLRQEGWSGLARFFVIPNYGYLMLEENDYIVSGGGMLMIKESINASVNGSPAILVVKRSHSGKSVTELTWATDQKIYKLAINRSLAGPMLNRFIELANMID